MSDSAKFCQYIFIQREKTMIHSLLLFLYYFEGDWMLIKWLISINTWTTFLNAITNYNFEKSAPFWGYISLPLSLRASRFVRPEYKFVAAPVSKGFDRNFLKFTQVFIRMKFCALGFTCFFMLDQLYEINPPWLCYVKSLESLDSNSFGILT